MLQLFHSGDHKVLTHFQELQYAHPAESTEQKPIESLTLSVKPSKGLLDDYNFEVSSTN